MLPHYCGFYRSKIFCSLASYQHNSRRNVLNVVVILLISDDCWKYSNDNHHEESFSPRLSTWDEPSLSAAIIRLVVLCTRAVNVIREISQLQEKVSNCLCFNRFFVRALVGAFNKEGDPIRPSPGNVKFREVPLTSLVVLYPPVGMCCVVVLLCVVGLVVLLHAIMTHRAHNLLQIFTMANIQNAIFSSKQPGSK